MCDLVLQNDIPTILYEKLYWKEVTLKDTKTKYILPILFDAWFKKN